MVRMRLNLFLVVVAVVTHGFLMFWLPTQLLPHDARWGWLLIVGALQSLPIWALIHECMHGTLTGRSRVDAAVGRLLSICFGSPYRVLRAGHLLHHKYSRQQTDASEVYDDSLQRWRDVAPSYYGRLLGGLYVVQVISCLLFLLPLPQLRALEARVASPRNLIARLVQALSSPTALREVRIDALLALFVLVLSLLLYGRHAWMLIASIAARALLISMHDNVYHYGSPLGQSDGMSLRLPAWLSPLMLNFNFHNTHHRHPRLGWRDLPSAFERDDGVYQASWVGAWFRQLRGPLPQSRLEQAPPRS